MNFTDLPVSSHLPTHPVLGYSSALPSDFLYGIWDSGLCAYVASTLATEHLSSPLSGMS